MKRLFLSCLLVVGCTSEYERTYGESEREYEARVSACSERAAAGDHVFTLVNTDRWQIGATPLWSTSEHVRTTLGPPDSTFQTIQLAYGPDLQFLGYNRLGDGPAGSAGVTIVNDSLAYLSSAEVRMGPLSTDRGRFESGTSLAEIREAFPESYECRDWGAAGLIDNPFHPVLAATDTARGAHVLLRFQDERLYSVHVDYYMKEIIHGTMP